MDNTPQPLAGSWPRLDKTFPKSTICVMVNETGMGLAGNSMCLILTVLQILAVLQFVIFLQILVIYGLNASGPTLATKNVTG